MKGESFLWSDPLPSKTLSQIGAMRAAAGPFAEFDAMGAVQSETGWALEGLWVVVVLIS